MERLNSHWAAILRGNFIKIFPSFKPRLTLGISTRFLGGIPSLEHPFCRHNLPLVSSRNLPPVPSLILPPVGSVWNSTPRKEFNRLILPNPPFAAHGNSTLRLPPIGTVGTHTLPPEGFLPSNNLPPMGTVGTDTLPPEGFLPSNNLPPVGTL